jgi:hypothetical protein
MPFAINASGPLLEELLAKYGVPRITWYVLRLALGDDETVVSGLEAMLACGLIFRTFLPSLGLIVGRKLEDNDFFNCGTFQNFMTPMNGAKNSGVLLETGRSQLFVLLHLSCVPSPFARNDNVSGHFFSLAGQLLEPADRRLSFRLEGFGRIDQLPQEL